MIQERAELFELSKIGALSLHEDEEVLDEIFGLGGVPENPDYHSSGQSSIPLKENGQSLSVTGGSLRQESFVGDICGRVIGLRKASLDGRLSIRERQNRKPSCRERARHV